MYAGLVSKAHNYITVDYDDQTCMVEPPDINGSYTVTVFVQSTSRINMLKEGTTFLYCEYERYNGIMIQAIQIFIGFN